MRILIFLVISLIIHKWAAAQTIADTTGTTTGTSLQQVIIRGSRSTIKKDSLEVRSIYKKHFDAAEHKIGLSMNGGTGFGLTANGIFTNLAYRLSGKRKRGKAFAKEFVADMQDRHVKERFTPTLVATATGLVATDQVEDFMAACHMPYQLAASGTDMEMMMWIREQYKEWNARQVADSLIGAVKH